MKSVFILGGTGLIGYAATKAFLDTEDYRVTTFSLPPVPADGVLDARAKHHFGDINDMSDAEIVKFFKRAGYFYFCRWGKLTLYSEKAGESVFLSGQCGTCATLGATRTAGWGISIYSLYIVL
ncbi:hypothetical protein [Listeria cornellensis]|uniref:NAD-dependent epimerase/dehydratase n=1 Tax=Listeria cornellensis FSL F6-0969 TaxID=1265820 RepID=W7C564_9LIST|nr:hypothetical protein [Listeria cornellensis]EUJ32330.1 NAD-dependent epimerase/dehydratase [Listeria cornellensis FSL F6-0969]